MTRSMTAFARVESQNAWGNLAWEVRSVNHRYLDLTFKMPEALRALEHPLRELCRKKLQRGKVDCLLRVDQITPEDSQLNLNLPLLKQLTEALDAIESNARINQPTSLDLLKWPGVIVQEEDDQDLINQEVLAQFSNALDALIEMREREGAELRELISDKLDQVAAITGAAQSAVPAIIQSQNDRIRQKLEELNIEVDQNRLEQELVHLAQKADVAEELDRLHSHVQEVQSNLKQSGAVGRRLDFLMQELNREANTLASKAIHADTTVQAVELKVLIEQMREQVQNIE